MNKPMTQHNQKHQLRLTYASGENYQTVVDEIVEIVKSNSKNLKEIIKNHFDENNISPSIFSTKTSPKSEKSIKEYLLKEIFAKKGSYLNVFTVLLMNPHFHDKDKLSFLQTIKDEKIGLSALDLNIQNISKRVYFKNPSNYKKYASINNFFNYPNQDNFIVSEYQERMFNMFAEKMIGFNILTLSNISKEKNLKLEKIINNLFFEFNGFYLKTKKETLFNSVFMERNQIIMDAFSDILKSEFFKNSSFDFKKQIEKHILNILKYKIQENDFKNINFDMAHYNLLISLYRYTPIQDERLKNLEEFFNYIKNDKGEFKSRQEEIHIIMAESFKSINMYENEKYFKMIMKEINFDSYFINDKYGSSNFDLNPKYQPYSSFFRGSDFNIIDKEKDPRSLVPFLDIIIQHKEDLSKHFKTQEKCDLYEEQPSPISFFIKRKDFDLEYFYKELMEYKTDYIFLDEAPKYGAPINSEEYKKVSNNYFNFLSLSFQNIYLMKEIYTKNPDLYDEFITYYKKNTDNIYLNFNLDNFFEMDYGFKKEYLNSLFNILKTENSNSLDLKSELQLIEIIYQEQELSIDLIKKMNSNSKIFQKIKTIISFIGENNGISIEEIKQIKHPEINFSI